ncbi:molecular chaperone TorD family protein [Photobacterium aquimaris]|uniref:DMSO reductase n=1 Tax=Photobacterium aquimaris TaxID=512643 RepID=A0A2T3I288_9GAMM|nr:molecular chaperone TorD family protein [Photobacterium aquimaris]OBU26393.1 DMSO reductase [Photobacterium aquimaris]PQJ40858.1 DMSO reductase [Photobacterium aquimaris]PSU12221.1 DMSO reductase [Photobacterium aquimaris]
MEQITILARVFGSLFYYPLTHTNNLELVKAMDNSYEESLFSGLAQRMALDGEIALATDFQQLFEGMDVMPAPPWGSVYLDREQVIFGDSLLRYREFLAQQQMALDTGMREPEDQFGLMLLALANLIEQQQHEAAKALLEQHLLPWAYRYLELVEKSAKTKTYQYLAIAMQQWLRYLQQELVLTPADMKVYF